MIMIQKKRHLKKRHLVAVIAALTILIKEVRETVTTLVTGGPPTTEDTTSP